MRSRQRARNELEGVRNCSIAAARHNELELVLCQSQLVHSARWRLLTLTKLAASCAARLNRSTVEIVLNFDSVLLYAEMCNWAPNFCRSALLSSNASEQRMIGGWRGARATGSELHAVPLESQKGERSCACERRIRVWSGTKGLGEDDSGCVCVVCVLCLCFVCCAVLVCCAGVQWRGGQRATEEQRARRRGEVSWRESGWPLSRGERRKSEGEEKESEEEKRKKRRLSVIKSDHGPRERVWRT